MDNNYTELLEIYKDYTTDEWVAVLGDAEIAREDNFISLINSID